MRAARSMSRSCARRSTPTSPAITAILEANDEPVNWPDVPRAAVRRAPRSARPGLRLVVGELDGVRGRRSRLDRGRDRPTSVPDRPLRRSAPPVARPRDGAAPCGARRRDRADDVLVRATGGRSRRTSAAGCGPWWPLLLPGGRRRAAGRPGARAWRRVRPTSPRRRAGRGVDRHRPNGRLRVLRRLPDAAGFVVDDRRRRSAPIGWARRELRRVGPLARPRVDRAATPIRSVRRCHPPCGREPACRSGPRCRACTPRSRPCSREVHGSAASTRSAPPTCGCSTRSGCCRARVAVDRRRRDGRRACPPGGRLTLS